MDPNASPAAPAADPSQTPTPPAPEPAAPPAAEPGAPQEVVAGTPAPTLEQVHQANLHALDNEPEPAAPADPDAPDAPGEPGAPNTPPAPDAEPTPAVEPPAPEPAAPEPAPEPAPAPAPVVPEPVVNTDPATPGADKIAVRGFDGKTYYFNNLEEVPEDFEPASYKEWGVAVNKFVDKSQNDKAHAQADADLKTQQESEAAQAEAGKAIQKQWDSEISQLTADQTLPTDQKARDAAIEETYQYIAKQLDKGIVIDNFTAAFKTVQYDKMIAKQKDDQKKLDDKKKESGSMVQGGGAPEAPRAAGRFIEAPPAGVGLDAVHQKYTHQLANPTQ